MAKKIFGVYLAKLDAPNSEAHARLELPASPWELHDAMDKVQLQENEELYLEIDDYYGFEYLAPHLMELDASLNELHAQARGGLIAIVPMRAERDRSGGQAAERALHRRADRARIQYGRAPIGAAIDAREHAIRLLPHQIQPQPHAVGGRTIHAVSLDIAVKSHSFGMKRRFDRGRMPCGAALPVRREHRHAVSRRLRGQRERAYPGCKDSIVI